MDQTFCPYCIQPLDERAAACPTCFEDLGRDALLEMSMSDWLSERRPCPVCLKAVHPLTHRCPFCADRPGVEA